MKIDIAKNAEFVACARHIEQTLNCDFLAFFGGIDQSSVRALRKELLALRSRACSTGSNLPSALLISLNSHGGNIEVVDVLDRVARAHYSQIYFCVPSKAMSAAAAWCLSGDRLYMDAQSSLGPTDFQLLKAGAFMSVPVQEYVDFFDACIKKPVAALSEMELEKFRALDIAEIENFRKANVLAVEMVKQWLATRNLLSWLSLTTDDVERQVVESDRQVMAEFAARQLANNNHWRTHSRLIGAQALKSMGIQIVDYESIHELQEAFHATDALAESFFWEAVNAKVSPPPTTFSWG